jgi:hypothetical protein
MTMRASLDDIIVHDLQEPLIQIEEEKLEQIDETDNKINAIKSCIFSKQTANTCLILGLAGLGAYETCINFVPSLFRSPSDPNLKPNLTENQIEIIKPLFLTSGLFFMSSSALYAASICLENHKKNLMTAFKVTVIAGAIFELAPFIVAFS